MNIFRNSAVLRNLIAVGIVVSIHSVVSAQNRVREENQQGNSNGLVQFLEVERTAGPLQLLSPTFIPASDQQAHFSLATLNLPEIALRPTPGGLGPNPDPTHPNDRFWWDVRVKVTRSTIAVSQNQGVMLAIDKDVFNLTHERWTDFHMTLGQGVGGMFQESDEFDNLWFKHNPAPLEKTGAFRPNPELDEPFAPDNLWWFADGTHPGVKPGQTPIFWLGINVPDSMFGIGPNQDPTMAFFTLRQHASVPEPSSLGLLAISLVGLMGVVRRQG